MNSSEEKQKIKKTIKMLLKNIQVQLNKRRAILFILLTSIEQQLISRANKKATNKKQLKIFNKDFK